MKWIIRVFIIVCVVIPAQSCLTEASCEEAAEVVKLDSCNIIVSEFSKNEYKFFLSGINPTGRPSTFKRINYTWGYWFVDKIAIGDTVVKRKNELRFYIHKKDTIMVFPFKCKGEIYN